MLYILKVIFFKEVFFVRIEKSKDTKIGGGGAPPPPPPPGAPGGRARGPAGRGGIAKNKKNLENYYMLLDIQLNYMANNYFFFLIIF